MTYQITFSLLLLSLLLVAGAASLAAEQVGFSADKGLVVVSNGKTDAIVAVSPAAKGLEQAAAADLVKYIGLMSGAAPALANTKEAIDAALKSKAPVLLVGELALQTEPGLRRELAKAAKAKPMLRADAVVVKRDGNRVYLAGTNGDSHYFAAAWLLQQWGCRWYIPTGIGECIPERPSLSINTLHYLYAPPFEMRSYWCSWNGDGTGKAEFQARNFMNGESFAGMGHALAHYTEELAKKTGKSSFNVPFSEPATAEEVVKKMGPGMEKRPSYGISLAIEDGSYTNESAEDAKLQAGIYDKYFLKPMMTDPMMALYTNVGKLLDEKYQGNPTRFGGMAYVNVTIPPQWKVEIPERLVMWLAPIDIDPIHGMDDPLSPPRQEYREMMYRWADLMDGRLCIYDYDQGMLVWRDIPNPSHMAFAQDVKHYAKAKIIGINTESRNAIATIFTNLFFRGQLMWNPNADVRALEQEFYTNFYGPAAAPMGRFWDAVNAAWTKTIVTEHEYMAASAIYTPELMKELAKLVSEANKAIAPLEQKANRTRNEELYVQRMVMMRKQWAVMDNYLKMVFAAGTDADFAKASEYGKLGMAARIDLAKMNPTFTTHVVGPGAEPTEPGGSPAWWPGEVKQYMNLHEFTNGAKGTRIATLPLEWAFHRDPRDTGLPRGWAYKPADLAFWKANKAKYDVYSLKDYPTTEWETVRVDTYPQAQGVRHPDGQSFTGFLWYKTNVNLKAGDVAGPVRVRFPGIFNECWLYVNGHLVAHREQNAMWWYNDYAFEWDVDLTGKLAKGDNDITLRFNNPHHFGGLFRRPFLYRAMAK
ncbi:MAG: DUF4838 domain-containing protein [Armatimonadota bacterium]